VADGEAGQAGQAGRQIKKKYELFIVCLRLGIVATAACRRGSDNSSLAMKGTPTWKRPPRRGTGRAQLDN
jgi:hypothetical protein